MRLARPAAIAVALAALASTAATQPRASSCGRDRAVADLGYDGIDCTNCVISRDYMEFLAEPTIGQIRRGGPADGRLRDGDVLVAVNGRLITTRSAWRYLATLSPDDAVRLTIRRNGMEREVTIVPEARCRDAGGRSAHDDATFTVQGGQIVLSDPPRARAGAIGGGRGFGRGGASAGGDRDTMETVFSRRGSYGPFRIASPPRAGTVPGLNVRRPTWPTGWIGVGLECDACHSSAAAARNGDVRWTFDEEPVLAEVVRGGPAWRAGLRPGDRLLSIDGHSITTPEGGRRWGNFRSGQEISLTVRRSRSMRTFSFEAEDRPMEYAATQSALPPDTEAPVRLDLPDNRATEPDGYPALRMSYDVGGSLVSINGRRAETYFDRRTGELVIVGPDFTVRVKPKS